MKSSLLNEQNSIKSQVKYPGRAQENRKEIPMSIVDYIKNQLTSNGELQRRGAGAQFTSRTVSSGGSYSSSSSSSSQSSGSSSGGSVSGGGGAAGGGSAGGGAAGGGAAGGGSEGGGSASASSKYQICRQTITWTTDNTKADS